MEAPTYPTQTKRPSPEVWRRYTRLLMQRWWILLLFVSTMVCYRAYQLQKQPDEFVSSAKLVLQGRIQIDKSSSYQEEMTNLFGTQKDILEGPTLARRVNNQLKLLHSDLESSQVQLYIERAKLSGVINIKARGQRGAFTQAYLNTVLDEYMDIREEMRSRVSNDALSDVTDQLNRLREQVDSAEKELKDFHQQNDIIVLQNGSNRDGNYLTRLVDKRSTLETRLNFLKQLDVEQDINRRSQADANAAESEGGANMHQLAASERDFLRTKREIAMLEVERNRRAKVWKPRHPGIIELNSRISAAQALLKVFRDQSTNLSRERARALEVELTSLNAEIAEWEKRTLATNRLLAASQHLTDKVDRVRSPYDKLLLKMHEIDQAKNLDQDTFSIMERASTPYRLQQSAFKPLLGSALMGLLAGVVVLMLLNRCDDTLHSASEYFERFSRDFLGAIPKVDGDQSSQLVSSEDERPFFAEAYRKLRSSILYKRWPNGAPKTMLITSAIPFDGKSTVASNLAAVLAMSGSEVLLVDADLRRGALHKRLGKDIAPGLSDVLLGSCPLFEAIAETDHANLDLLPRGKVTNETIETLLKARTREIFTQLERVYDYIVVDSAPVLVADDTLSLAPVVDTTLFVIRLNRTPGRLAERALANLEQRQVSIGGVILNFDHAFVGEYYTYDYSKYYASIAED